MPLIVQYKHKHNSTVMISAVNTSIIRFTKKTTTANYVKLNFFIVGKIRNFQNNFLEIINFTASKMFLNIKLVKPMFYIHVIVKIALIAGRLVIVVSFGIASCFTE